MPELIIKYKSAKALKALQELTKSFDIVIETTKVEKRQEGAVRLPITFAKNPDIRALAGIWQDREITLEDLRKEAWRDRR